MGDALTWPSVGREKQRGGLPGLLGEAAQSLLLCSCPDRTDMATALALRPEYNTALAAQAVITGGWVRSRPLFSMRLRSEGRRAAKGMAGLSLLLSWQN